MKIEMNKLRKMIKEEALKFMNELVEGPDHDKMSVWNAILDDVPQYAELGINYDEEGIVISRVGESYSGKGHWVVVAEPFDGPADGFIVDEIAEGVYEVDPVGLMTAKDELYGEQDVGYEGW